MRATGVGRAPWATGAPRRWANETVPAGVVHVQDPYHGIQRGWDTVDEVKANMLGWATRTFPELKIVHHREAGQAYGRWNNLIKNGRANYVAGYHPVFMLLKCARRSLQRPFLVEGIGLGIGFLGGYLNRVPQVADKELIKYFRRQQMNRLLGRKSLWD